MNILVYSSKKRPELKELNTLNDRFNVTVAETIDELKQHAKEAKIILLCKSRESQKALQTCLTLNPKIAWVHNLWAGVDSLLFPELKSLSTVLTNAKGVYAEPLAEFVILACLYFAKDVPRLLRNQQSSIWEPFGNQLISGKTIGIFGYGEIGKAVAKKANALGMNVIATRKNISLSKDDPNLKQVIPLSEVDTLFKESDYLVCAAPLTNETKGFINQQKISLLKKSTVLINIGRGPVINEEDLIKSLRNHEIRGAALDVFNKEPLDSTSPLWKFENVLVSPHSTDQNEGWLEDSMKFFVRNSERFLKGERLLNIVDIDKGY